MRDTTRGSEDEEESEKELGSERGERVYRCHYQSTASSPSLYSSDALSLLFEVLHRDQVGQ